MKDGLILSALKSGFWDILKLKQTQSQEQPPAGSKGLSAVCGFCSLLQLDSDTEESNKASEVTNVHFVA